MATSLSRHSLNIFADYHQFYLWDANVQTSAPTDWSEDDVANRVKVDKGVVVVCPIRNTTVPVDIEIHSAAPDLLEASWDHIAEASLLVASGNLEVHECTAGSAGTFAVTPCEHRVRVLMGRLGELISDGLEGNDHYTVQIWPAPMGALRVIKRYVEDE